MSVPHQEPAPVPVAQEPGMPDAGVLGVLGVLGVKAPSTAKTEASFDGSLPPPYKKPSRSTYNFRQNVVRFGGAAALVAAALPIATTPSTARDAAGPSTSSVSQPVANSKPGVWRWAVKTMSDPDASGLDQSHTIQLKVADAANFVAPDEHLDSSTPRGAGPEEKNVYVIDGWARSFKPEADGDYHLLITDQKGDDLNTGNKLGVEVPNPDFAPNSVAITQFKAARQIFEASISHGATYSSSYTLVNPPIHVKITGTGFWDEVHGQKGMPSGFEIHPVLAISILP